MADNQALEKEQSPGQLERDLPRIRYLPDWEIPMSPPKRQRSLFSRDKISRSIRRSRLAAVFRPKPTFVAASRPTSDTSTGITKESFVDTRGIHGGIPSLSRSSTAAPEHPLSPLHRIVHSLPPRRYLGGHTRQRIILIAVAILLALGLSLGLGIGLGLRHGVKAADLQPPGGLEPANLPPAAAPSPAAPSPAVPSPITPSPAAFPDAAAPVATLIPNPLLLSPQVHQGNITLFSPGFGACGVMSADYDFVCALPHAIWDAAAPHAFVRGHSQINPFCAKLIRVTTFVTGVAGEPRRQVSVDVQVTDRCADCGPNDLDLAMGAWRQIADEGSKVVSGTWQFL